VFDDDRLTFSSLAGATGTAAEAAAKAWVASDFVLPPEFSLDAAIDALIRRTLEHTGGNVSAAARALGVTRDFIRYRLKDTSTETAD